MWFLYGALLYFIVLVDSLVTTKIGMELNPLILWLMAMFNLSLSEAMLYRVFILTPLIMFLTIHGKALLAAVLYLLIYIIFIITQIM